jgi:glutamate racemase
VKALVIACNTATTAARSHLQEMFPDLPVVGVIAPGAAAAVRATKKHAVMVLATETTVRSEAYQRLIQEALPGAQVQACPSSLLVALAEEGMVDNKIAEVALQHYLSGLQDEDTVLLGCTHFPVFKSLLKRLLPSGVQVVDSAHATAEAVRQILEQRGLQSSVSERGTVHYLVTDSIQRFETVGEIFLGEPLEHKAIELVDACG